MRAFIMQRQRQQNWLNVYPRWLDGIKCEPNFSSMRRDQTKCIPDQYAHRMSDSWADSLYAHNMLWFCTFSFHDRADVLTGCKRWEFYSAYVMMSGVVENAVWIWISSPGKESSVAEVQCYSASSYFHKCLAYANHPTVQQLVEISC